MAEPAASHPPLARVAGPFLRRVLIRDYKSIRYCRVSLAPLTVLVGPNSAGKSNFLDALQFLGDSLQSSLPAALRSRGGIEVVRRRGGLEPKSFSVEVELGLGDDLLAAYGFEVAGLKEEPLSVMWERVRITDLTGRLLHYYSRRDQKIVESSVTDLPRIPKDRLYLGSAASLPEFTSLFDELMAMRFYDLEPRTMMEPHQGRSGELLEKSGENIATVFGRLCSEAPVQARRIQEYLKAIVPEINRVETVSIDPWKTLRFWLKVEGVEKPLSFDASTMSDGMLHAFGVLVAINQRSERGGPLRLVGVEEPETALHPAAAGALMDAIREASVRTQILVTTHSPDLLDLTDLSEDAVLVVLSQESTTSIAQVNAASIEAVRNRLYSPGELLQMNQLQPDRGDLEKQRDDQTLFPGLTDS